MRVSSGSGDVPMRPPSCCPCAGGRARGGGSEITVTTQPAEAAADLLQAGRDPADEHAAVAPAAHVADEVRDEAVEILDPVGAPQRAVQRPGDAQPLQREGLVESFAQG